MWPALRPLSWIRASGLATGAGLVVRIHVFGPLSGAHFNPIVTLAALFARQRTPGLAAGMMAAQFAGGVLGVYAAHLMFGEPVLQVSAKLRSGGAQVFAEAVATFGLIGTILGTQRARPDFTPVAVGLYITSAYCFTASTSFANPAVTLARSLSDTFAGIEPASVPAFVAAQAVGAALAVVGVRVLYPDVQEAADRVVVPHAVDDPVITAGRVPEPKDWR